MDEDELRAVVESIIAEGSDTRAAVAHLVGTVPEAHLPRIRDLLERLSHPVEVSVTDPDHAIFNSAWVDGFTARLQVHHATNFNTLARTNFEDAFIECSETARTVVTKATSATTRFWDLEVGGIRASLKTEGAKDIRNDRVHISKLSEAAWIQDCRTPQARRARTIALFQEYLESVGVIYMLRSFKAESPLRYELVEIPVSLFEPIVSLPNSAFAQEAPTIAIPPGQDPPNLSLRLDRSDSKITIARLLKDRCTVHATWLVPTTPTGG